MLVLELELDGTVIVELIVEVESMVVVASVADEEELGAAALPFKGMVAMMLGIARGKMAEEFLQQAREPGPLLVVSQQLGGRKLALSLFSCRGGRTHY